MTEEAKIVTDRKKSVFDKELKPIADALGISASYELAITANGGYNEYISIDNGLFMICVNMDSTQAMKKDFIAGIYRMMQEGKLRWIKTGEYV